MEIERKWLVGEPPGDVLAAPGDAIDQGYLVIGVDGGEARIRRRGERCWLTVKSGRGLARSEHEVELSVAQFEALWPATAGRRVEKVRREVGLADGGGVIELDVYGGTLAGLVVAEVEFSDTAAAGAFRAPPWFGAEVTDDARYKNQALAVNGAP